MSLGAWILGLVGPWAVKALTYIGVGVVSYAGIAAALSVAEDAVLAHVTGFPAAAYQVLALAGFLQAVNIWLAALALQAVILATPKLGLVK